jgi:N-acetylneuraminic acid mutarotase
MVRTNLSEVDSGLNWQGKRYLTAELEPLMIARFSRSYRLNPFISLSLFLLLAACGSGGGGTGNTGGGSPPLSGSANEWTWMRGANADTSVPPGWAGPGSEPWNSDPYYGTLGAPTAYNQEGAGTVPGGRNSSAFWTDKSGNFWLFGGDGLDANINEALLNDLWEYSPSTNEWTWIGGSSSSLVFNPYSGFYGRGQAGVYGTQGSPGAGNIPGSRMNSVSLTDGTGNFWLFGGYGYDSVGSYGYLNDLWEYGPSTNEWTWISGSSTLPTIGGPDNGGQPGVYGIQGTPAATNVPPGTTMATGWVDANGNLWLFGGPGISPLGGSGYFSNNLWEFDPSTKEWTWVSGGGSTNTAVYGILGVPSAINTPGDSVAVQGWGADAAGWGAPSGWTDSAGDLWLLQSGDMWEFNPITKEWTWMAGDNGGINESVYGTQGVAAAGNGPGVRAGAVGWADNAGDFWLFGGYGYDSTGYPSPLNDLWKFNIETKMWTWVGGSNLASDGSTYGKEGVPAPANLPGNRYNYAAWTDNSGNFWLFAGWGIIVDGEGGSTTLNDLWRYEP